VEQENELFEPSSGAFWAEEEAWVGLKSRRVLALLGLTSRLLGSIELQKVSGVTVK